MSLIVKICGLTNRGDARVCASAGADWLGFIFHPASPRGLTASEAAAIETVGAKRVGVFVDQTPAEVRDLMKTARLDLAQLHGRQSPEFGLELGPERVIQTFWPQAYPDPRALAEDLARYRQNAAYFLFDAGRSGGGHGRSLDPGFLKLAAPPAPWLLAGGLDPEKVEALNIEELINLAGFDFNSGVESAPGIKNHDLTQQAVRVVKRKGEETR